MEELLLKPRLSKKDSKRLEKKQIDEDPEFIKVDIMLKMAINRLNENDSDDCICIYGLMTKLPTKNSFVEQEIIPALKLPLNNLGKLELNTVINKLKEFGYPISEAMIKIYNYKFKQYILFGNCFKQPMILAEGEYLLNSVLKINCTCTIDNSYDPKIQEELEIEKEQNKLNQSNINNDTSNINNNDESAIKSIKGNEIGKKKNKEAKIGVIIEKVNLWRKLFNGYFNSNNEYTKLSLVEAATELNISKKTLDDFLRQLRLGRKYGFDFNDKINHKVGILRDFVKDNNKKSTDKK